MVAKSTLIVPSKKSKSAKKKAGARKSVKKATSKKAGTSQFYRILDRIQNLDSGLSLNQKLPYEKFMVQTVKLSKLLKKLRKVSLIKIDIEGGEYDVFEDLTDTKIISIVERIIFESHVFNNPQRKKCVETLAKLRSIGKVSSKYSSPFTSMNIWTNSST